MKKTLGKKIRDILYQMNDSGFDSKGLSIDYDSFAEAILHTVRRHDREQGYTRMKLGDSYIRSARRKK